MMERMGKSGKLAVIAGVVAAVPFEIVNARTPAEQRRTETDPEKHGILV